jgi:excisionase family DNA binding protein
MSQTILIAEEVAKLLRVNKQRVYELTRTNQLPGVIRLGERQYRYSAQAIENFLHGGGTQGENENDAAN